MLSENALQEVASPDDNRPRILEPLENLHCQTYPVFTDNPYVRIAFPKVTDVNNYGREDGR